MVKFVACTLVVVSSFVGFARTAYAETVFPVMIDEFGNTWQIDLDSRYSYISDTGVRQVSFKLSTANDRNWQSLNCFL